MSDFASRRMMMVDTQVRPSDVTKFPIIEAMLHVPREVYVPSQQREAAYIGVNIPIAPARVILEARTMGKLLDALDIQPSELILDIGCGLGYSAALLARLAETVVAVEDDEALSSQAQAQLAAEGVDNAVVVQAALAAGAPKHAPFDVIILEGGIEVLPDAIADQLKEGGRIGAIFMEGGLGIVKVGIKTDGQINWRFAFNATAPVLPGFAHKAAFAF